MNNQDRILDQLISKGLSTTANIVDYKKISNTLYKVVCTFSSLDANVAALQHAIASATDQNMVAVDHSFTRLNKAGIPTAAGFIRASRHVTLPYTDDVVARFTVIGKNVLMDTADERLWNVESVNGQQRLVRQASDNLEELIVKAKVSAYNVPKLQNIVTAWFQKHEYVSFASTRHEEVRHGFVLAGFQEKTNAVEVVTASDVEVISPDQVVVSVVNSPEIQKIISSYTPDYDLNAVPKNKADYTKYYKELYGYAANSDFWKQLNQIINQHAVI